MNRLNKQRLLEIVKMEHESRARQREIEIFGWYGAVAILFAFILVSFGTVNSTGFFYQFLNLTGGLGLTSVALLKKDYQLVIVNAVWAAVALVAIIAWLVHIL